jgi:hypothetical protein
MDNQSFDDLCGFKPPPFFLHQIMGFHWIWCASSWETDTALRIAITVGFMGKSIVQEGIPTITKL